MKPSMTLITAALLLLGLASATQAALFTWTGTGSGQLWSTATNWSGGVAPVVSTTTDDIAINGAHTSQVNQAWTIKSLHGGNGFTLNGADLTLNSTITCDYDGTINNNLILGTGAGLITHGYGSTFMIKGNVTSTNIGLDIRGGKPTSISGVVSLGTAGTFITNTGTKLILSNAANSYSGDNVIAAGTLSTNSIANAGTACTIGSGSKIIMAEPGAQGTLQFTGTNGGSSNRTFTLLSTGTGDTGTIENTVAGKTLTLSGNFQYDGTSRSAGAWKFTGDGNGLVSGNITTTGASLTKEGTGTWTLTGSNNSYGGGTTVSTGTLLVSNTLGSGTGTGSVTVASGAKLGGTGIIDPGTGNTVTINGILAPGESGVGTLTVGSLGSLNNATLTGTYLADIGDLVKVYGQLALGGSSILTLGGSPTPGTNYMLASYTTGGLTGTFATINNLPGGWQVTYGSDAITLGLIPEPASLLLLAAGGLLVMTRARRRQQQAEVV